MQPRSFPRACGYQELLAADSPSLDCSRLCSTQSQTSIGPHQLLLPDERSHLPRALPCLGLPDRGVDVIFHLAAAVGVGQSMFEIAYYTAVNNQGSANLLQAILDTRTRVEKIVVASSMSIYGEGQYFCSECGPVAPPPRPAAQLKKRRWHTVCPQCGE